MMEREEKFILWFSGIGKDDAALVGGKNASLGEMFNHLPGLGVRVPDGFAITTSAYNYFISHADLEGKIKEILREAEEGAANLDYTSSRIKRIILSVALPEDLERAIVCAYAELEEKIREVKKSLSLIHI